MQTSMTSPETVLGFALAGKAHITLTSERTNHHFTYRIKQCVDKETREVKDLWFVSILIDGNADEGRFDYIGVVREDRSFALTKKSTADEDSVCVKAFRYFWKYLLQDRIAPQLQVQHEGKCGRCGRTLTHPESIESGIGPECASIMASDMPSFED